MKLLTKTGAVFDRIAYSLFLVAGALIVFFMLAVCFDVVTRYFLGRGQVWTLDIVSWGLLFMTFFGTTWVLKQEGHVKMDLVLNRLNPETRALLNAITSIFLAIVCLLLAWYSGDLTWELFQRGARYVAAMEAAGVLKAPLVSPIPVGSFLLSIQFLRRTVSNFKVWRGIKKLEMKKIDDAVDA